MGDRVIEDSGELEAVREEVRRSRVRGGYFYLILIATVLLAFATSTIVTVKLIERSERKLCAVVIEADDAYHEAPPVTKAGKVQAANYSRLRSELGCPPYKESE